MGQLGMWDWEKRHKYLEEKQDLLKHLNKIIPWEEFREILEKIYKKPRKSQAGRKAIDVIVMFKLLILQRLYNISDEQLEYQVNDRLSFMRFLGMGIEDKVPDGTTVWLFRQKLTEQGLARELFEKFEGYLEEQGYQARGGQILDATLVPVPKQHNTKEENEQLKKGETPQSWEEKTHKLAQKDQDARWTKKNGKSHYGYKNHINVDVEHKLIRKYAVTPAAVHDSKRLTHLLDGENEGDGLWADSAYRDAKTEKMLGLIGYESHINERAYRNRPLTEAQKEANRERSKTRSRVEHIFGDMVQTMGGKLERLIGQARIETQIGLKNLTYNLKRYVFLKVRTV